MRRKYKLILIILISSLLAYIIYSFNKEDKITFVAMGDGIASGETYFNMDGFSYNDYLEEYLSSHNLLKKYSDTLSMKNYKLNDITLDINNNIYLIKDEKHIKQLLHNADLITICFGEEELVKLSMTNDLTIEIIRKYISSYNNLIKLIRENTEAKIILIGLYENFFISKSNLIIINSELANISHTNNITFINISEILSNKEYFANDKEFYFNYEAHQNIAKMIVNSI